MNVKKMYNELLFTSLILNLFDSLLTACAIFGISYIFIYFYRQSYVLGLIIAIVFFIRSLGRKIKENKIILIEQKYPDLQERLRTSYDYKSKSNTIIDSLHEDIVKMMKNVDVNAYLDIKKISLKILLIMVSLSLVLYFSSIGLDVLDIKTNIVNSALFEKLTDIAKDIFEGREQIQDRPLLKEGSLLDIGDKDFNVSIDTYNTELDISDIGEPEKNDYGGHYPDEVKGAAQKIYDAGIPQEDKEVIKEYFKKING